MPGTKPVNIRYRPVNPALEPDLKAQVDKWLKHGVIEPCKSPWNFGLVPVKKKCGAIRWCVDLRRLNAVTIKDRHAIGDISDNLARLASSKVFSAIDGAGAFHQIMIEKKSRDKTAFATSFGQFRFIRMPFGVCNGPSTYARLVHICLLYTSPSPRDQRGSRMPSSA